MHIHKFAHAAILLENQDGCLLFDPGAFSFPAGGVQPEELTKLTAIFITHSHGDHCSPDVIKRLLAASPQAVIYTNQQIVELLQGQGIAATAFENGSLKVGDFTVEALPAAHDTHLISAGTPTNIAYRVNNSIVHPGDSFSVEELAPWKAPSVLFTPIIAPWQNETQLYDFVQAMQPQRSIPIHDGYVQDFFREGRYQSYVEVFAAKDVTFVPLGPGMSIEL